MSETIDGIPIPQMPDLGSITDASSFVAEKSGSGRFGATAVASYVQSKLPTMGALPGLGAVNDNSTFVGQGPSSGTYTAPAIYNYVFNKLPASQPLPGLGTVTDTSLFVGKSPTDGTFTAVQVANYIANKNPTGAGRVSVRTFGAKGDGVTDDTAAFNAAIAAAPNGGELYIPIGNYRISSTIAISKTLTVNGDGRLSSMIIVASPTADVFSISGAVDIYDLGFINASGVTRTAGAYVSYGGGPGRCRLDRFYMINPFYGIRLTAAATADYFISHGEILQWSAAGTGIRIDNGLAIQISSCLLEQAGAPGAGDGILITNCGDVDIVACQITGAGNCLMINPTSGQTCASVWATETYFDSGISGVQFLAAGGNIARCKFVGCWMGGMTAQGIRMSTSGGGTVGGIDFIGCHIFGNASDGATIFDSGCFDIQFNDCAVCGNSGFGIQMSTTQPWRIQNCRIGAAYGFPGNGAGGVDIGAGAANYHVSGNQLTGNSVASILGAGAQGGSNPGVNEFIYGNTGYASQNRGQATIPAGQVSVTVAHGLNGTPRLQDIFLTNLTGEGNPPAAAPFVLSPTSTTFVIEIGVALVFNMGVSWKAVLPCSI